jgi:hypothetical protein
VTQHRVVPLCAAPDDRCDPEVHRAEGRINKGATRSHAPLHLQGPRSSSAAVPAHCLDEHGCLIDQLIHFAFDTLGAQHLDLRIYEAK